MPRFAARRRSVAVALAHAMVAASAAALLVGSATAPPAGAAVAPGSTVRASVHNNGRQSPHGGIESVINEDGTALAFVSDSQLDPTLDNGRSEAQPYNAVYVRDLVHNHTVMISRGHHVPAVINLRGTQTLSLNGSRAGLAQTDIEREEPQNDDSFEPTISANGRYVAFTTQATNIVITGQSSTAIVLCDRDPNNDGTFDEQRPKSDTNEAMMDYRCILVSGFAAGAVSHPKLSADADRIVWERRRSAGSNFSRLETVALRKDINGLVTPGPIQEVPSPLNDDESSLDSQYDPAISGDGNRIAMHATFNRCECPDFNAIMVTDMSTGDSFRVDFENVNTSGGTPVGEVSVMVMFPAMSFDGTEIAFTAEQLDDNGFSAFNQPYVYVVNVDYPKRAVTRSVIASRDNRGDLADGRDPALSADGRYLAFTTDSVLVHDGVDRPFGDTCIKPPPLGLTGKRPLNLAGAIPPERPNVDRALCQVVLRDLVLDQTATPATRVPGTLASPGTSSDCVRQLPKDSTCAANNESTHPSLSGDGTRIGFDSSASDLVPNDDNGNRDAFVRTLEPTLRGDPVAFGPVELGQSLLRTAQLNEIGNGTMLIESIALTGPDAKDFTITGDTCVERVLHQTENCRVTLRFSPAAIGDKVGQLVVRVRGGRQFVVDLTGSGSVQPVPRAAEFKANPTPLDFGSRLLLSTGPESVVTVTNNGEQPLQISAVAPVGPGAPGDFQVAGNTCAGKSVAGGGTCTVSVRFSPTLPGDRAATLQFTDNAPGSPHLVDLRGSAPQPVITSNPGVTVPSRVVTVTGTSFPPGKTVTVTFTTAVEIGKATVAADGTFRAQVLIFNKAKPENRTTVATVDGFPALVANTQLLVVFPSVSPAEFVMRG